MPKPSILKKTLSVFLFVFGVLTIKSGGDVLFFSPEAQAAAGDFVPFVLWSNFVAGFFYVAAAVGIFLKKPWATKLTIGIAIFTLILFAVFGLHIYFGGAYETRTLWAMVLRSAVWVTASILILKASQNKTP